MTLEGSSGPKRSQSGSLKVSFGGIPSPILSGSLGTLTTKGEPTGTDQDSSATERNRDTKGFRLVVFVNG